MAWEATIEAVPRGALATAMFLHAFALAGVARAQSVDRPGIDDALHFGASAGLAAGGYALGAALFDDVPPRIALGAGIALFAGALKELLDLAGLGTASWSDIAWDAAGIFVGLIVAWVVDELVFRTRAPPAHPGARAVHTAGSASGSPHPGHVAFGVSHRVRMRSSGSSVPR